MEADLSKRRGEEIRAGQTPNHLALGAGRNTCNKKRCCGPINCTRPAPNEFVQRPVGQPATGKPLIDLGNTKWQDRFSASHRASEMLDALSEVRNNPVCARLSHS